MSKIIKNITLETLSDKIDNLATKVDSGFKRAEENRKELARMISSGFENTATKTELAEVKTDVTELKTEVFNINLRLDNLAPKFEVRDLEKRVTRLETKTGIRHK